MKNILIYEPSKLIGLCNFDTLVDTMTHDPVIHITNANRSFRAFKTNACTVKFIGGEFAYQHKADISFGFPDHLKSRMAGAHARMSEVASYIRNEEINYNSFMNDNPWKAYLESKITKPTPRYFEPVNVIYNDPATIVFWDDGSKTVIKCLDGDVYSEEAGFALCFMKKHTGNDNRIFHRILKKFRTVPDKHVNNPLDLSELYQTIQNGLKTFSFGFESPTQTEKQEDK